MEGPIFESRINLVQFSEQVKKIKAEIGKVIVGQSNLIDLLITALLADGHVLIEGVPGVAKTLTAKLFARILSVDFSRIQFTPDLMPSDVMGTAVFNLKVSEFEFRPGPIFSNIVLIDEINRAPAKTQSALFEVMEERQVTVDGSTHPMKKPYMVLATQNPIEHEGTYRLPEAQLDRFIFKLLVGYPNLEEEMTILSNNHGREGVSPLDEVRPQLTAADIEAMKRCAQQVHVEKNLIQYIAQIVQETRNNPLLFLGASPRASLALLNATKAFALIQGRDFISPEDVKHLALPVLRHRVALSPEKEMEGLSTDEIMDQLVNKIEVPR